MPALRNKYQSATDRRHQRILSIVHMVYRLVNSTYNVRELSLRLTRLLCHFIKAQSARIFILDPAKQKGVLIASFDNKINVLLTKKNDLGRITPAERRVTDGYAIFDKRLVGLPLVADENIGAVFVRRAEGACPFTEFDKEMMRVFAEQAVTAIRNLQLYEEQQRIILDSMKFIDKVLAKRGHQAGLHKPTFFYVLKTLAERLNINKEGIDCLYYASILHDAGAIDVPYEILSKTSQLSPQEFKVIHELPARSVELIRPVEFLGPVLPVILYHHERYDGSGYPSGLKREQIPVGARVLAVVEAFEAMITGRPYKKRLTFAAAVRELQDHSGTQFDPKVVKVFCGLCRQKKFRNYLSRIRR